MSTSAALGSQRQPRILACVLCQHRKIKCDRNMPCSNCIKAKVTCTPSTPAPIRKRRRPNQDLQERLARCEELLKKYTNGSGPQAVEHAPKSTSPPIPATVHTPPSPVTHSNGPGSDVPTPTPTATTNTDLQSCRKAGTMVVSDDGSVRFIDSYVFANVYDELQKIWDTVDTEDHEDASVLGGEEATPDGTVDLLLYVDISRTSLEDLQPEPVHLVRLWQIFVERVNSLVKLVHIPSMQPTILEAAANMSIMPLNIQALLFSICASAVIAMNPAECERLLGMSQSTALLRFNAGTKTALTKYNFMKNYTMTSLQALSLYFFSLEARYDRDTLWIISGTIIRIAQKMGYHRDGQQFNLSPFETEMRRRIWWHILIQDSKCAIMSGLSQSALTFNWDTKRPLNLNDTDLSPNSTWPLVPREGPSEMVFCVVLYELFSFKLLNDRDEDCNMLEAIVVGEDFDGPDSSDDRRGLLQKFKIRAQEMEDRLCELEEKIIDTSMGNAHIAALAIRTMLIHRSKEALDPLHEQPEWGTEIFTPKDKFFKVLVLSFEHKTSCYESMAAAGFHWFMKYNLQHDLLAVFTGLLLDRPMGSLSDRAWKCIGMLYSQYDELSDMSTKQYVAQAQLTLRAWRVRETAFARVGQQLNMPPFMCRLRELVPSQDLRMSIQSTLASPPATSPQTHPTMGLDQLFGDYLNPSQMNWDVLGDIMMTNGNQFSASMFDGYYTGDNNKNLGYGTNQLPL